MSPFFQTLISTIIGAIFGGSGVTFLTFLIQRHDRKTDKRQEEYAELSHTVINSYTKLSDTDKETVKQLIKSLPM